jgi:hypothetical protein
LGYGESSLAFCRLIQPAQAGYTVLENRKGSV